MPEPQAGTTVLQRYRLLRQLARGGMSTVWIAEDYKLARSVAVKLLSTNLTHDPELRRRFEREAMAVARLQSPHIVQIFDYGIDADCPVIVMELLHGEDLRRRLKRQKRLPLSQVVEVIRQIARGLGEAHAAGVIHRDLKPSNIFFSRGRQHEVLKILDFGVAKADGAFSTGETTSAGQILGTPQFMSPEQAKAKGVVDHRTDLWSLGVLVYNMATGQLPFNGHSPTQVLLAVASEPYHPLSLYVPDAPPALDQFIDRALNRDPDQRFSSAAELANTLASLCGTRPAMRGAMSSDDEDEIETVLDTGTQDLPLGALLSSAGASSAESSTAGPHSPGYTGGMPGTVQLPAEMLFDELPSNPSSPSNPTYPSYPSAPSTPSHGSLGSAMLSAPPADKPGGPIRNVLPWAAAALALGFVSVVSAIALLDTGGEASESSPTGTPAPAATGATTAETVEGPEPIAEEPEVVPDDAPEEELEKDKTEVDSVGGAGGAKPADTAEADSATPPAPVAAKPKPKPYPKPKYKPVPKPPPTKKPPDPYGSRF